MQPHSAAEPRLFAAAAATATLTSHAQPPTGRPRAAGAADTTELWFPVAAVVARGGGTPITPLEGGASLDAMSAWSFRERSAGTEVQLAPYRSAVLVAFGGRSPAVWMSGAHLSDPVRGSTGGGTAVEGVAGASADTGSRAAQNGQLPSRWQTALCVG